MPALQTQRLTLVGRIHSLRLTAQDLAFSLHIDHHGDHGAEYSCHSNRPEVIAAAAALEPGQLIGVIAVPVKALQSSSFHIERLELLGRKVRQEAAA